MHPWKSSIGLLASCLVIAVASPSEASAQQITIPRIEGAITLDGELDEDVWQQVPSLPMTMFEPRYDGEITRATSIRIAHDGEFLYAAGEFHDDGEVRANTLERDYDADDDIFNVVLDTFNDRRSALWFVVSPAGTRQDGSITDDAEGDGWNHPEYDSFWDAEAVIHPWGWSAEMRIPLSSLRFQARNGRVVMGLIAGRKISRLRERHTFPAIRPGQNFAQFKPSLGATVVLEGVSEVRPRYLTPYVLGGLSGEPRAPGSTAWEGHRELGGDLKIGVAQNLVLDLTINTDFAQTEVDEERINLTRFDLLYPEKRRFFLERSGAFDFGDGQEHRLFHSRRIGLSAAGEQERIYGGGRLVGRLGRWDVGLLSMQTETIRPGSGNVSAARFRRSVLDGSSFLGGIATARVGSDGTTVTASGADADLRIGGSHYISGSIAASTDTAGRTGNDHVHSRILLEDRDRRGFGYRLEGAQVGSLYDPPVGFLLRRGSLVRVQGRHGEFGGAGFLQERVVSLEASARHRPGGSLESAGAAFALSGVRRGGGEGSLVLQLSREDIDEAFQLSPSANVPEGSYRFGDVALSLTSPTARSLRAALELSGGEFFDGYRVGAVVRPALTLSRHLELSGDVELNRIGFSDRDQSFDAAILRLRARAALDAKLSAVAFVQYNSAVRSGGANVRVRYNFREGQDLYVVLTAGRSDASVFDADPDWRWTRRSLLVKYAHAMAW